MAKNNTTNINQPVKLPWKLQFELVNRSLNTVFSMCKKQKSAFITSLNEGIEELRIKCTKAWRYFYYLEQKTCICYWKLINIYSSNCDRSFFFLFTISFSHRKIFFLHWWKLIFVLRNNTFFLCSLFKVKKCYHFPLVTLERAESFFCPWQDTISFFLVKIQKKFKASIKI